MRRVDCRRCGVVAVEEVPSGDGKRTLTKAYMLFLARWARRLSWKQTAQAFRTSWEKVFDAVYAAQRGCHSCLRSVLQATFILPWIASGALTPASIVDVLRRLLRV